MTQAAKSQRLMLAKYSFGVGDRFAHQANAQLRAGECAAEHSLPIVPVWNKSNREHVIVGSQPESVRTAAEATVRELGWPQPFQVDADHIHLETVDGFLGFRRLLHARGGGGDWATPAACGRDGVEVPLRGRRGCANLPSHRSCLVLAKEIYAEAFSHREELGAPYASVIDIEGAKLLAPGAVAKWTAAPYLSALRHDNKCREYNPSFRQLIHVGYKVAAKLGGRYLDMLDACDASIARNVTTNLYERHLKPIFLSQRVSAVAP